MNPETRKTAVIAGASGLVGSELLKLLLNDITYVKVFSLVRKKGDYSHPKLTELVIDFDQMPYSLSEVKNADDIFCCLGTTMKKAGSKDAFRKVDYHYPLELANWAREIKARHFLMISAMGADPSSSIFYSKTKGEAERDIALHDIPSITFFRPSLLFGNRIENRTGEKIGIFFAKALSFLFTGPLKNYKGIEASNVAKAMVLAASQQTSGRRVVLSGEMQ